jgi:hypothetical protein
MKICSSQILAALSLLTVAAISANAQLTINANFTTADTTDFAGSMPIADLPNASVVEATIDQSIAQVTSLISTPITLNIDFLSDPNTSLGASVGTGLIDLPYSTYLSYLQAEPNKSAVSTIALASLPAGPGTGINNDATKVRLGGALLDAVGDTADGNSLISSNGGFAGTVALNMSVLNTSRTNYDNTKFDLVSTVTHEVDEILGIGGEGSTITPTGGATDVGPTDLFRYSAPGVRSYSNSANVSSYFSINGGHTPLVHFNQNSQGDYGDWGDGVTPADGQANNPPQVQDAFGDTTAEPNMGPNEAIALNAVGWRMSAAGLQLESVPEPPACALLFIGALLIIGVRRRASVCREPNQNQ